MINSIKLVLLSFTILISTISFSQIKPHLKELKVERAQPLQIEDIGNLQTIEPAIPTAGTTPLSKMSRTFTALPPLVKPDPNFPNRKVYLSPKTGLPIAITGTLANNAGDLSTQAMTYLRANQAILQIENPASEFTIQEVKTDKLGHRHLLLTQQYQGIPIYGAQIRLHQYEGTIGMMNGRYFATPTLDNLTPSIAKTAAQDIVYQDLASKTNIKTLSALEQTLISTPVLQTKLVLYPAKDNRREISLAWQIEIVPNIAARWLYFVDAQTGDILTSFNQICKIAGHYHHPDNAHTTCSHTNEEMPPTIANATDLSGFTRTINTFETGGAFYLIDATRNMHGFSAANASEFPNSPVSTIWTIDGQNNAPQNDDFDVTHIASSNNSWNNPTAVSAHYNAGQAYEYFENTFSRNSINGQGGNIISIINVAEENGASMDNAFWNGAAMFYGNGSQAFTSPLARSLDVAGHEMSHGVIQNTANLEYFGESGALNESFADVFGAMIDRDDWTIGEGIVNTNIFQTGALRDMQNPNNGGNSLNDNGYQPAHVDEQFFGNQDNGGVHINSGIPNRAYYLFATAIGKDKAEEIYYDVLENYLVRTSQFIDMRIAVVQAATDRYGANSAEVNAAMNAFSSVGIGSGTGTTTQTDVEVNEGTEFVLMTDQNLDQLYIFTPTGDEVANPLTSISTISKPSITDDGSRIVYVSENNTIQAIDIDWQAGSFNQTELSDNPVWRNAAISKDGSKVAALTDDLDNRIWIFDLNNGGLGQDFTLVNPTTASGGGNAGDVQFADIIEFDFTGEWILYDANNRISSTFGDDIEYWDIGFVRVFDNENNDFGDGFISKLFSGLPENSSVGNPTFSKNSDFIIALDFIDEANNEYSILGANIETGDVGTIYNHSQLGYPNYSVQDDQIVFDDVVGFFAEDQLSFISLNEDKISSNGSSITDFVSNGKWGIWFANGTRVLTNDQEVTLVDDLFHVSPNPFEESITVVVKDESSDVYKVRIFDVLGKEVYRTAMIGQQKIVELGSLSAGAYWMQVENRKKVSTVKIVKR